MRLSKDEAILELRLILWKIHKKSNVIYDAHFKNAVRETLRITEPSALQEYKPKTEVA